MSTGACNGGTDSLYSNWIFQPQKGGKTHQAADYMKTIYLNCLLK